MIKITLPDGSIKEVAKNSTPMEVQKVLVKGWQETLFLPALMILQLRHQLN